MDKIRLLARYNHFVMSEKSRVMLDVVPIPAQVLERSSSVSLKLIYDSRRLGKWLLSPSNATDILEDGNPYLIYRTARRGYVAVKEPKARLTNIFADYGARELVRGETA
jgi:hypothetical protein